MFRIWDVESMGCLIHGFPTQSSVWIGTNPKKQCKTTYSKRMLRYVDLDLDLQASESVHTHVCFDGESDFSDPRT